ncbi:MAG: hypothetical protein RSC65_04380, partial [Malacoplasma sp.]
ANNVVIKDTIPNGATFISGSITSTAPYTGTDPNTGLTLTNPIPAGGTVTITYKVKVTSIPVPNPIENTATINFTYTVDPANPNTGSAPANNVVVKDILPAGTVFIPGSITSTDPYTGTDPNTGLTLTNPIAPGATVTITYKVKVTSIPNPNVVTNTATVGYKYTVN